MEAVVFIAVVVGWFALANWYMATHTHSGLRLQSPEEPVRLCCGQRHWSVVCPDGLVMCCICFDRFEPNDETREDVCWRCAP
jgi:hypothetical protein